MFSPNQKNFAFGTNHGTLFFGNITQGKRGIDANYAETTSRVFAVLTGADCAIDGLDPVSCDMFLKRPNGGPY